MIFEEDRKPEVISAKNIALALALHLAFFGVFYVYSRVTFRKPPVIIPIELTFEAPPEEVAELPKVKQVEPPKPKVEKIEPPKAEEKMDAVEKIVEKKKPEKKKPEKKPEEKKKEDPKPPEKKEEKKPEPSKKSAKELREERLKKMREGAKVVKSPKPTPVAGTGKKLDPNWKKLLNEGYKPGATTQLGTSEAQRCISIIRAALDRKWNELQPEIGQPGVVQLTVSLSKDGRIHSCKIAKSCGSKMSDNAALKVANAVGRVYGLSPEFVAENPTFTINYTVESR